MTISTRVKQPGKPWRLHHITIKSMRKGPRKKIALKLGKDLTLELSQWQAIKLTNQIVDTLERP